jgi:hypothetical protein
MEGRQTVDIQRSLADVQLLAVTWRKLLWVLALSNIGSGLGIILGPGNSRSSPAYQVLQSIEISYVFFAAAMMVGGFLVLWERWAWVGHLLSAISLLFWSLLIIFISLVAHQPSSFGVAFWTLGLGGVHLVILYGRVYRHQFHAKVTAGKSGG